MAKLYNIFILPHEMGMCELAVVYECDSNKSYVQHICTHTYALSLSTTISPPLVIDDVTVELQSTNPPLPFPPSYRDTYIRTCMQAWPVTAVVQLPQLSLCCEYIDFGCGFVGQAVSKSFTLHNCGYSGALWTAQLQTGTYSTHTVI